MMQFNRYLIPIVIVTTLSRLLPHPLHFTAVTSLCVLSYGRLDKSHSLFAVFASLSLSDIVLGYLYGWPIFAAWSIFTYSGFAFIIFAQHYGFRCLSPWKLLCLMPLASLFYWLWTNLGTWLISGLYPSTWQGLLTCLVAAIPFLKSAVLGDFFWFVALTIGFRSVQAAAKMPHSS